MAQIRVADRSCEALSSRARHAEADIPRRYNIYGGEQDVKAVFGDVQRFIR